MKTLGVPDEAPFLLDVTRLIWRRWRGRRPTGIDRVCLAYLRHFGPRAQAVVQHDRFRGILDRQTSQELFDLLESVGPWFKPRLIAGAIKRLIRDQSDRGKGRPYLNVGHTGLDSAGFRDWIGAADVKPIYLVHDLIPITHPQFCRAGEAAKHRERMRTALLTAAGVIGNSQATLDGLAEFAHQEGLPKPSQLAAWLGGEPLPVPATVRPPERPTFVTLGTIEARKNHLLLLDVWSRLIDRHGDEAPRLLIIGQRGWRAENVFRRLDEDESLRGHVEELNDCSDEELAGYLASARALLFSSVAEGYGLPLVEAVAMGVPVIATDLPVFEEIAGPVPTYLGPQDADGWEGAILDYAKPDSRTRAEQIERLKSFRMFDWDSHFTRVEAWLKALF